MAEVLSLSATSARKLIQTSSGGGDSDGGGGGGDREEGRSDGLGGGVVNDGSARQAAGKAAKSWR